MRLLRLLLAFELVIAVGLSAPIVTRLGAWSEPVNGVLQAGFWAVAGAITVLALQQEALVRPARGLRLVGVLLVAAVLVILVDSLAVPAWTPLLPGLSTGLLATALVVLLIRRIGVRRP